MTMHYVSVICPIYNEEKFIENCIVSILNQDYPKDRLEVLFVDGMSTDSTRDIVKKYIQKYDFIQLLDNPARIVPPALNRGIEVAQGDVIVRIDGHCIYPRNYISILTKYLFELGADNVGALWNTLPAKDTTVCNAIAIGVSHKFGIGNSLHKIGAKNIIETDTVPFGCFRKEVFERLGLFDNDLIRNQDDEFNGRIIKNGGKIFLIPELSIDYYARDKIAKMMKMFYQYGLFKPLVNKKLGSPATVRQFFPFLFVCGLIIGGILAFFSSIVALFYWGVIFFYLVISLFHAGQAAQKEKNVKFFFLLPVIFFLIHISYGTGYLVGIYKLIFHRPFTVRVNR